MALTVREAAGDDLEWVVETARAELGDEYQVHTRRQFRVTDGRVLIAVDADQPAGFLSFVVDDEGCEVLALAVAPDARRCGVGRALLRAITDRARSAGAARLHLVTTDHNVGAQAFYESLGLAMGERRVGAVDECRRRYKPTIPEGIHDELVYEMGL